VQIGIPGNKFDDILLFAEIRYIRYGVIWDSHFWGRPLLGIATFGNSHPR
jgi:hypothetical protein